MKAGATKTKPKSKAQSKTKAKPASRSKAAAKAGAKKKAVPKAKVAKKPVPKKAAPKKPAAKPVAKKPAAKPAPKKPIAKPAPKAIVKPVAKPIVKPVAKPIVKPVAKPVAKPAPKRAGGLPVAPKPRRSAPPRPDFGAPIDEFFSKQPTELRPILDALRALVDEVVPNAHASIKWGMPFYTLNGAMMCALGAHAAHVNLILAGAADAFADPDGLLSGEGGGSRHLKVETLVDFPRAQIRKWLATAASIASKRR